MLLAGDVGGTKTNLAVFSSRDDLRSPLVEATLPSAHYTSLENLVREFLAQINLPIEKACFGVAGPVFEGKAKITNLPWIMDERKLQEELHIPTVHLLNDLSAMGHAVPFLTPDDLYTLNKGNPIDRGTIGVIAPGTGLGEAFLIWNGTGYSTSASEGGHTDFAPISEEQLELLRYMLGRFEHVSYELICSGMGLPHLYSYFASISRSPELAKVNEQLALADDKTPIIIQSALNEEEPSPICVATLKAFAAILGAQAGNLALTVLATGGIYIGGGIPPRILSFLESGEFMHAFVQKGRFSSLLTNIPVHIILNRKVALLGAAYHGFTT